MRYDHLDQAAVHGILLHHACRRDGMNFRPPDPAAALENLFDHTHPQEEMPVDDLALPEVRESLCGYIHLWEDMSYHRRGLAAAPISLYDHIHSQEGVLFVYPEPAVAPGTAFGHETRLGSAPAEAGVEAAVEMVVM